jgi:hypothetical protein
MANSISRGNSISEKSPGKGFKQGGHCFDFPDFLENYFSVGGYGSGTCGGEGVGLLKLKGFVDLFRGTKTIWCWFPSEDIILLGLNYWSIDDLLYHLLGEGSGE